MGDLASGAAGIQGAAPKSHVRSSQGYIDRSTGKAELTFLADFMFTAGPLYSVRPPSQLLVSAVVHRLACYALPRCLFLHILVSCQDISQLLTQHAGSPVSGHNQLDNGECARKDARWPGAAHGPGWLCQVSRACAPLCFVHAVCSMFATLCSHAPDICQGMKGYHSVAAMTIL